MQSFTLPTLLLALVASVLLWKVVSGKLWLSVGGIGFFPRNNGHLLPIAIYSVSVTVGKLGVSVSSVGVALRPSRPFIRVCVDGLTVTKSKSSKQRVSAQSSSSSSRVPLMFLSLLDYLVYWVPETMLLVSNVKFNEMEVQSAEIRLSKTHLLRLHVSAAKIDFRHESLHGHVSSLSVEATSSIRLRQFRPNANIVVQNGFLAIESVPVKVQFTALKSIVTPDSASLSLTNIVSKDLLDLPEISYTLNFAEMVSKVELPSVSAKISLSLIFVLLSTFIKPYASKSSKSSQNPPKFVFLLHNLDLELVLANDFHVRVLLEQTSVSSTTAVVQKVVLQIEQHQKWQRLLSIQDSRAEIAVPVEISIGFIKASIPHEFLIYKLFDSITNTIKTLKQHLYTLKTGDESLVIEPKAKPPILIPELRFHAKMVALCFEADPFETQLAMAYQLGKVEQRSRLAKLDYLDNPEFLGKVYENISTSWVSLVKEYTSKLAATIAQNSSFLEGTDTSLASTNAPVLSLYLESLELKLAQPKLPCSLPDYINRVGKGIPHETEYTTLVPLHADLSVGQVRAHLMDLPLPLAYLPWSSDKSTGLQITGNLVLLEQLGGDWRWVDVKINESTSMKIPRSLSSMKTLLELDAVVKTDQTMLLTWGAGIQPILRQLSLCVDSFSKPKMDPSPKLGVWDKIRYILHGYVNLVWATDADLRINLKGSMDPYEIFGPAAGFSFVFRKSVRLELNNPHNNPSDFVVVRAKETYFGIANHSGEKLPCWCAQTPLYLSRASKNPLSTSLFGCYLNPQFFQPVAPVVRFKQAVSLKGEIEFKLTFDFNQQDESVQPKPHYLVTMVHPPCDDNHDSYAGFRTSNIHMGIQLATKDAETNSLYLTPVSFSYFTQWFKLFGNGISLPIRNGSLFQNNPESVKFGSHLHSFGYQFDVKPLYLFHGYRMDLDDKENQTVLGFKGKVDGFHLELNQNKEPMVLKNETLHRQVKLMKMKFSTGRVEFKDVDVRVLVAAAEKLDGDQFPTNCHSWFDREDLEEQNLPSFGTVSANYLHLFHCMDMAFSMDNAAKGFTNVVEVEQPLMRWNTSLRNKVFQYLHRVGFRNSYTYYSSYHSLKVAEQNCNRNKTVTDSEDSVSFSSRELRIDNFNDDIREISNSSRNLIPMDDFLIKIKRPQIQLIENEEADFFMLLSTPEINISVISISDKKTLDNVSSQPVERRLGSVLHDTDVFLLDRSVSTENANFYGSTNNWPLFLPEPPEKYKILSRTSMLVRYDKISGLVSDNIRDKLMFNMERLETKLDSEQARALYSLVTKLLLYSEPRSKKLDDAVKEMVMVTDFGNLDAIFKRVRVIAGQLQYLDKPSSLRNKLLIELYTRMRVLVKGGGDDSELEWILKAGSIKMDFADQNQTFLRLEIVQGEFKRVALSDGTTVNRVSVGTLQARNMDKAIFPDLLSGMESSDMVDISWTMADPIGGIRVAKNVEIRCSPIKFGLEEDVGRRVIEYMMGDNESEEIDEKTDTSDNKDVTTSSGLMMSRSKQNFWFQAIQMEPILLSISLRAKGLKKLLNVTGFELLLPPLELSNKLWAMEDLLDHLKKYILHCLKIHFGKILKHKLTH
ncbi:hypothetical protein OGAPHI_003038 [Ogataea philodendri]|uniref:FMP27 GFWDK domain-containing protein n=1 Tax=Ogataea philodendri TaxID=1378263 RepID=A0A9P8P9I0_9ASCO|nr:uncharacterized protein OGAPHI_003038 [Ogataea philodendri]KAH3667389.1 hypothetical protein OGAPHI_003038 [Ogataea philodendri]